jgi:hypothetical protein
MKNIMNPISPIRRRPAPDTFAIILNSSLVGLRVSFNIRTYSLSFSGIVGGAVFLVANLFHFPR